MNIDADELAGIVDLFGFLSRPALVDAVRELAFRRDEPFDAEATDAAIDDAVAAFALVQLQHEGEDVLVAGPAAFPSVPAGAEDLPHILDAERRAVDRSDLAEPVRDRLTREASDVEDSDRARVLIDITYDAEAWTDVELDDVRDRLEAIAGDRPG